MSRKELVHGLRAKSMRRRLRDEHVAETSAGEQSHHEAVESLRQWHIRRVEECLAKTEGGRFPIAQAELTRTRAFLERAALQQRAVKFLHACEASLAKGEDIEERPYTPKPRIFKSTRPEWMRDASLLPKKPPGR